MSDADKLVKRLRNPQIGDIHSAMSEAADMIEQMAQRIEADDAAYKELEKHHAPQD